MSTEQRSPFKEIQNRPGLGKIKEQSGQEEVGWLKNINTYV